MPNQENQPQAEQPQPQQPQQPQSQQTQLQQPQQPQAFGTMQPAPAGPYLVAPAPSSSSKKILTQFGIITGIVIVAVIALVLVFMFAFEKKITCEIPGYGTITFTYRDNSLTGYSATGDISDYYTSSDFDDDKRSFEYYGAEDSLDNLESSFKAAGGTCTR